MPRKRKRDDVVQDGVEVRTSRPPKRASVGATATAGRGRKGRSSGVTRQDSIIVDDNDGVDDRAAGRAKQGTPAPKQAKAAKAAQSARPSKRKVKREDSDLVGAGLRRIAASYSDDGVDTDSSDDERKPVGKAPAPLATRAKAARPIKQEKAIKLEKQASAEMQPAEHHSESEDEDALWETVDLDAAKKEAAEADNGDLDLMIEEAEKIDYTTTGKRKVSARQMQERVKTHFLHCLCLLAHGAIRNKWINRPEVHRIMQQKLAKSNPTLHAALRQAAAGGRTDSVTLIENFGRAKTWFRRKFTILKPGLRRYGYRKEREVQELLHDPPTHYEAYANFEAYLQAARMMSGSVDLGAQLFTALLRSYHFNVRLVFSVQPLGYKWNQAEQYVKENGDAQMIPTAPPGAARNITKANGKARGTLNDAISIASSNESAARRAERAKRQPARASKVKKVDDSSSSDGGSDSESSLSSVDSDDFIDVEADLKDEVEDAVESFMFKKSYPIYWTEVLDARSQRWLAIDPIVFERVFVEPDDMKRLQPGTKEAERLKRVMGFVLAYSASGTIKDVTLRYVKSMGKVAASFLRAPPGSYAEHDIGRLLRPFRSCDDSELARREDEALMPEEKPKADPLIIPETLSAMKSHPKYVIERHLREKEALKPGAKRKGMFINGKGPKAVREGVYLREDVLPCLTVENYHKEGRKVKANETPRKWIKARAVTTNRKREYEQQMAETGEPVLQPIYSVDQTEYIIPPPIRDGVIPKNAYGNADIFTPSMVPKGGAHLPYRGMARICKQLGIDHAEAVVGFEFKRRGAFPQIQGVLVAEENVETLMAAWKQAERDKRAKELVKRQQLVLQRWRKFFKGLQIRKRIARDYAAHAQFSQGPGGRLADVTETKGQGRMVSGEDGATGQQLPPPSELARKKAEDDHGISIELPMP